MGSAGAKGQPAAPVDGGSDAVVTGPGSAIATELRRRRRLLGFSQAAAARKSGVARTVINEIELGRRVPSVRTYERLRAALGLEVPAHVLVARPVASPPEDAHLIRLAACLIAQRRIALHELAAALGIGIPAVREGIGALGERLARVGVEAVVDGVEVELCPVSEAAEPITRLGGAETDRRVTAEQMEVVAILAARGSATRRDLERLRGGRDSESLLRRLVRDGLVTFVGDDASPGAANVYRLTTRAIVMCGQSTIEALQARVMSLVDDAAQASGESPSSDAGLAPRTAAV